jgi:hypothetical protein
MVEFERGASELSLDCMTMSGSAYAYASFPEDGRGVAADDGVSGVFIAVSSSTSEDWTSCQPGNRVRVSPVPIEKGESLGS